MDKKQMHDESTIPLVRGRGIFKGITPQELFSIVGNPGTRVLWDSKIAYYYHF